MCILISTTDHPDYPLIICSNRDEFFARPTQLASRRVLKSGAQIVSPLDLGREERGTWIGVTSEGKIAMLLNYREKKCQVSKVSRGILPIDYLSFPLSDEEWYTSLSERLAQNGSAEGKVCLEDIGGFTLVYGKLEMDPASKNLVPLNVMSNRGDRGKIHVTDERYVDPHLEVARQKYFSVSNSLYHEPWPKAKLGETKLAGLVKSSIAKSMTREELAEGCFEILSADTYNPTIRDASDEFSESKLLELRNSIFIPPLEVTNAAASPDESSPDPKYYGTRTQTAILYHKSGMLYYYERDLYDGDTSTRNVKNQQFAFDVNSVA